jgi:hypothetical protein
MPAKPYSDQARSEAARKQQEQPLDSESSEVKVAFVQGKYEIAFPFNMTLVKAARDIPGASFDKDAKIWRAPAEEYEAVKAAAAAMRSMVVALPEAHAEIKAAVLQARADAIIKDAYVKPIPSKDGGKPRMPRSTGEILAVNKHFVAQSNGKNYVVVHERALLADNREQGILVSGLEVGKTVSIGYYNGAGLLSPAGLGKSAEHAPAAAEAPKARMQRPKKAATQEAGPSM